MMSIYGLERLAKIPRPYPDRELYQNTLESGFRVFPERKENYDKFLSSKRTQVLDYLPIKLDIENVSRCNLRCSMCQVSAWDKGRRAVDMSFEDYKSLLDSQAGLVEIKIQGLGEPFLGESFAQMVEYARKRHIWVRSTTNGTIIHLKERYKQVIDADISELQVSIDGASQETYEAIRKGGQLKTVLANAEKLNSYCEQVGRKRTRMWVVAQQVNFDELQLFPPLAAQLGFSRLSIALDLNDWGQDEWKKVNDPLDIQKLFTLELANEMIELGEAHDVEVTFWFIDQKYDVSDPSKLCPWPFERSYVSSDMRIVPCCMIANPDISELGKALTFAEKWNANEYQKFRGMHLSGRIPHICKGCYVD